MHWRLKGTVQKVLGVLPGGERLHFRLQRRFGGLRRFHDEFALKIHDWRLMVGHLRRAGCGISGARFLEIGTGWYPTFPFSLYLAGASRVHTYDLKPLVKPELVRACADALGDCVEDIAAEAGVEPGAVRARHARLVAQLAADPGTDLGRATEGVVEYHAPADAAQTGLAPGAVDVVFSNSVLEHVLPEVIPGLYREAGRVLAPGGVMFHSVNCGDHYAYRDHRISQLNYLRYSDRQWRFWNNAFLYQNRLRAHAFVDAAVAAGFAIELDTTQATPEHLQALAEIEVHPQFAHLPPERLCPTTVDFIARRPLAAAA